MKTLTIIAALISTSAFATTPAATASSSSASSAAASASADARGVGIGGNAVSTGGQGGAGGTGGTGQGGQAGVTNNVGGSSASLTYVTSPQPKTVTIKNTPDMALSNIAPTSPCMGGTSVGGSGPGFSIGIGTTWKDADCSLRETARSFAGFGLHADAIAVLCSSEYAAAAPTCINLKAKESQAPAPVGLDKP